MGIEKVQITRLAEYARGEKTAPTPAELGGPLTPNQRDMANAIRLTWARMTGELIDEAVTADLAHLRAMDLYGHMAVGPDYGNEQMAPGPHDAFFYAGRATSLREALLLKSEALVLAGIRYWQMHFALCRIFWTLQGPRMPCARVKPAPPRPLAPVWGIDALAGSRLFGWPLTERPKVDTMTVDILSSCSAAIPRIVLVANQLQPEDIILGISLRKWVTPNGGFVAALDHDRPMNDRLSWVSVDAAGNIIAAGNTLDNFTAPAGEPLIIGGPRAYGPIPAPVPVPAPAPSPQGDHSAQLVLLASQVHGLLLARKELTKQLGIESELRQVPPPRPLSAIADDIAAFGIGDGQPQKAVQNAIVTALRSLT